MPATAKYYNRIPKDHPAYGDASSGVAYYRRNRKICNRKTREYKSRCPNRRRAHIITSNAIRAGRISRFPCEDCRFLGKAEAHHDDYSKPLDIRWLCTPCHKQWHAKNGEGLNP